MANFIYNNVRFEQNDKGYFYKIVDDKKIRISRAEYEEAQRALQAEAKPAKKGKKSKKTARTVVISLADDKIAEIGLTQNQLNFLNKIPEAEEFVQGVESTFYTDLFCDTVADVMNAMVVGAMISTLREKDLIYVAQGKVNGKKCKYFGFTDLGKALIKELGLV